MIRWLWCCIHCGRKQALCCVKECRVNALVNPIFFIFFILNIFCIFSIILHIVHIVHIKLHFYIFLARIDDGCDVDNWHVEDCRTGSSISLRADRWYQEAPASDPKSNSGDFAGIRITIWNRTRVRRFLIHNLAGGGSHNLGYHAFIWETMVNTQFWSICRIRSLDFCMNTTILIIYHWTSRHFSWTGVRLSCMASSNLFRWINYLNM